MTVPRQLVQLNLAIAIAGVVSIRSHAQSLFYGGDPTPPGAAYLNGSGFAGPKAIQYVNFVVPNGETWQVSGLFANTVYNSSGSFPQNSPQNTQAHFEIRKSLAPGTEGVLLASGTAPAPPVPMTFSYGPYQGFRIECQLPTPLSLSFGSYWTALVPLGNNSDTAFIYLADTTAQVGSTCGVHYYSFDDAPLAVQPTSLSLGVLGTTTATPPFSSADFNRNGSVDGPDLGVWQLAFGLTMDADADMDCDVDGADFLAWQNSLGSTTQSAASTSAVPEPNALIACGPALALLPRRASARDGARRSRR